MYDRAFLLACSLARLCAFVINSLGVNALYYIISYVPFISFNSFARLLVRNYPDYRASSRLLPLREQVSSVLFDALVSYADYC